jgi:group II intron reverse transcriptase/maturase
VKPGNSPREDPLEGRDYRKRRTLEGKMEGTPRPLKVSTKLQRIAELARKSPGMAFTTLAHHIDVEFLKEAYRRTRKDGAAGVDEQSSKEYAANLRSNLETLLGRFKTGSYKAPPVLRVQIPKGKDKTRPIGIPTFEDKILQRAVAIILEAVYEQDFLDCSYGFRPKRSAHHALDELGNTLMKFRGGWIIEVDIQGYFDAISHSHLREILDQRVRDGVLRRTIHKWLKAGVMENGNISYPKSGSPQGGVISPILSNIFLHEVLDKWFEQEVKTRLKAPSKLIRYADDVTIVCASREDAVRIMEVLPKRLGRFDLKLHPTKTSMLDFRKPRRDDPGGPRGFTFLGFTHYWGKSRKGKRIVKRKTSKTSLCRAIATIALWCRKHRHWEMWEQRRALTVRLRGHYNYFGVTGNFASLNAFYRAVKRVWQKWLDRRNGRRSVRWDKFNRVLEHYALPKPRIVHSIYRT